MLIPGVFGTVDTCSRRCTRNIQASSLASIKYELKFPKTNSLKRKIPNRTKMGITVPLENYCRYQMRNFPPMIGLLVFFIESFLQMCFIKKSVFIQGRQRGGFCIVPS